MCVQCCHHLYGGQTRNPKNTGIHTDKLTYGNGSSLKLNSVNAVKLENLGGKRTHDPTCSPKSLERLNAKTGSCLPYIAGYKDDALC